MLNYIEKYLLYITALIIYSLDETKALLGALIVSVGFISLHLEIKAKPRVYIDMICPLITIFFGEAVIIRAASNEYIVVLLSIGLGFQAIEIFNNLRHCNETSSDNGK